MSAITSAKLLSHKEPARVVSMKMDNVKIWQGALLMLSATGYVTPLIPTLDLPFVGIASETVDNSAGADGDKSIDVYQSGLFGMAVTGAVVTDLMKKVYGETSNTSDCTLESGSPSELAQMIGRLVGIQGAIHWVDIYPGIVLKEQIPDVP